MRESDIRTRTIETPKYKNRVSNLSLSNMTPPDLHRTTSEWASHAISQVNKDVDDMNAATVMSLQRG